MGAKDRADAVYSVVVLVCISLKGGVHSFLKGLQAVGDFHHVCAQYLHPGHVGGLLFYVHSAHVNIALKAEVGRRGGQSHAVLACAGLSDEFLFAHVLCKQGLAHAVVQLVRAGVVQVLALDVKLHAVADGVRQALQM